MPEPRSLFRPIIYVSDLGVGVLLALVESLFELESFFELESDDLLSDLLSDLELDSPADFVSAAAAFLYESLR